jgi:hypothetical protein|tara:strand:+ start:111 stop:701 length:591 start_codon:yes stop_codon:yes gene_type:complete
MAKTDYRQYKNLITASEVVSKAMTNVNMDTSIIDDNIVLIAELTHLKPHLGDYFWGELRKKHHSLALNAVETTLLNNYILPCLSFYVKYELLNDMQYNTTSSGIVTNDDDWSDPADSSELSILKDDTFRKAEILLKDMMEWLDDDDNNGVYPEYESSQNDMHINGDNVVRLGGILAYGNKMNRYRSINKKDERYYN